MKILLCGYRSWAKDIIKNVKIVCSSHELTIVKGKEELDKNYKNNYFDLIFFIGWSWIIPKEIINEKNCICLHPSKLPKYRGGSPIQHQIIEGESKSAVTLFLMDNEIDHGPIIWQKDFNLEGELKNIFNQIKTLGFYGIYFIIETYDKTKKLEYTEQNHSESTNYKRRTKEMSEITHLDFSNYTAKELYRKIIALQDPYPNAYIICKDNTKLYLKKADHD